MKISRSSVVSATVVALTAFAGASAMQAPPAKPAAKPAPPAAKPIDAKPAMKPQDDHGAGGAAEMPGPEHKQLAKYVGNWTFTSKLSMTDVNDQPPMESTGTAKITSVLGGRFILEESNSTMMGQPVEGRHYTGYNSATKQYESNWTWTMNNSMMNMTGTSSDAGKTIICNAAVEEAGKKMNVKVTMKMVDDDHFTVEMRGEGPGGGLMETQYARKK